MHLSVSLTLSVVKVLVFERKNTERLFFGGCRPEFFGVLFHGRFKGGASRVPGRFHQRDMTAAFLRAIVHSRIGSAAALALAFVVAATSRVGNVGARSLPRARILFTAALSFARIQSAASMRLVHDQSFGTGTQRDLDRWCRGSCGRFGRLRGYPRAPIAASGCRARDNAAQSGKRQLMKLASIHSGGFHKASFNGNCLNMSETGR
jgi:hypothetical protein